MKRVQIPEIPYTLPDLLEKYAKRCDLFDSSCSPEARVYFLKGEGRKSESFYLKRANAGTLSREALMTSYFHTLALGTEVVEYLTEDGFDWMLTRAVHGEDCTHTDYLSNPYRLAKTTGTLLRALHEVHAEGCPAPDRISEYLTTAEANYQSANYDKSHFPDSFGYRSAEEAYSHLCEGRTLLRGDTLIHGDYCLPNIILRDWRLSAFIDVDHGGIGDRHIDLFWGAWTLGFNLGTDRFRNRFFDAYGRDAVDEEKIKIIAATEVFG